LEILFSIILNTQLTLETGDDPEPTGLDTQESSESEVEEETNLEEKDSRVDMYVLDQWG